MTIALERPTTPTAVEPELKRLALDITRQCQANCSHCFNSSSPQGTHGTMTRQEWLTTLESAAELGVNQVQFIGGEPTLHPDLAVLIDRALELGMSVEVFTNLIHVRGGLWRSLRQRGVTLATSYYSDSAEEHEQITRRRGSYKRTRANIAQARKYRIPVRAAIVHVLPEQRVQEAIAELRTLGVTGTIREDRQREIGRGAGEQCAEDLNELCGNCADGRAAIGPDGSVAGCVMSAGMLTAGNVHDQPLRAVINSPQWAHLVAAIPRPRQAVGGCVPDGCTPNEDSCQPSPGVDETDAYATSACNPDSDGSDCSPAETEACGPAYDDVTPYGTATACNPDSDGSDCAPAETEACGPAY